MYQLTADLMFLIHSRSVMSILLQTRGAKLMPISKTSAGGRSCVFGITELQSKRTFICAADNSTDFESWVHFLFLDDRQNTISAPTVVRQVRQLVFRKPTAIKKIKVHLLLCSITHTHTQTSKGVSLFFFCTVCR